jgi:5-methylcytosine-specific restriction enzyme B
MAALTSPEAQVVYPAARRIVARVLRDATSVLHSRRALWREPVLAALRERLAHAIDQGVGPFEERLDVALADADDDVVQLAAEALYIHLLIAADVHPATKRRVLTTTLDRMDRPPRIRDELDAALDGGLAATTGAFTRRRLSQLVYIVAVAQRWRVTPAAARRTALADPWAFRSWLWTVEVAGAQAQREALLHLVHPETFLATVSRPHKRRLVEAHGLALPDGDVDRALLALGTPSGR